MADDIASLGIKVDSTDIVEAEKDLKDFTAQGKKTEKGVNDLQKDLEKTSGKFKTVGEGAKKSLNVMAIGVAALAVAGAAAFVKIGSKAIAAASDLEETQGKSDVVFKGMSKQVEDWSAVLQAGYAMSETESKKYLSNIQDLIVPTGMARDESAKLSNEFVKMAADLGSFNNLETSQVIMDIQSALAGGSETLTKYGINVKVAQVRQEALNQGWVKGKEAITQSQRVQAIYNIMMRDGADAMGDMERTQASYANQTKKLDANIATLTAKLGQELLPVATDIVTAVNDWIDQNKDLLVQDIAGWAEKTATAFGKAYNNAVKWNNTISDIIKGAKLTSLDKQLQDAKATLLQLERSWVGFGDEAKKNIKNARNEVSFLEAQINELETGNKSALNSMVDSVEEYADEIIKTRKTVVKESKTMKTAQQKDSDSTTKVQEKNIAAVDAVYEKLYDNLETYSKYYTKSQMDDMDDIKDSWMLTNDAIEQDDVDTSEARLATVEDFLDDYETNISDFLDDMLISGDSFGDAWDSLWKGVLGTLNDTLASMAVSWAASAVTDLWDNWSLSNYHTGSWLTPREELAVILKGEMIVPEGYADQIRNNLGENASFTDLAEASRPGGWETSSELGADLGEDARNAGIDALSSLGLDAISGRSIDVGQTMAQASAGFSYGAIGTALDAAVEASVGRYGHQSALGPSNYGVMGGVAGQIAGAYAVSGTPAAGLTTGISRAIGGWLGDRLGDLLDDRDFESIRDLEESGHFTEHEAFSRYHAAIRSPSLTSYSNVSTLGGFFAAVESAYDSVMGMFDDRASTELGGTSEAGGEVGGSGGDVESSPGGRGGVHGGADYIPAETTYLLDEGERVLSPNQNRDLTTYLNERQNSSANVETREMINLLRDVKNLLNSGLYAVAKNTLAGSKTLKKWDINGLPPEVA